MLVSHEKNTDVPSPIILYLLFNRGLELTLCFGQFFPQAFALLSAPFQLLLKLLQTCDCLPVSLILLMEKKTFQILFSNTHTVIATALKIFKTF